MRTVVILLVLALAPCAFAKSGIGPGSRSESASTHVLDAIEAPPLTEIDSDVFRFSRIPSAGGAGYVMTFVGRADGAWAEVVRVDGDPRTGWRETSRQRLQLEPAEYEQLAHYVDQQLRRTHPVIQSSDGVDPPVCSDGADFLAERLMDGTLRWNDGSCGEDHPNRIIAERLEAWADARQ